MVSNNTLKIKNFPSSLSEHEIMDFLKHFGAVETKIVTSKQKQKTVAYGRFENSHIAKTVLHRLHQLKIIDSYLCAEYAQSDITKSIDKISCTDVEDNKNKKYYKQFITKINAFNSAVAFNQPPPSHLKYLYPKPNRATLNNIAHALASVPKFYTQVLHLMNRMNLPPPFSVMPDPPQTPENQLNESSESELESDNECDKLKETITVKRTLPQKKLLKRPKFVKPPVVMAASATHQPKDTVSEMFEKVDLDLQPRKIQLKVTPECLQNKVATNSENENVGSFGVLVIPEKETEPITTTAKITTTVIAEDELNANRIPVKDLKVLPVFKDYHPGVPSTRLYIKNIAKTVQKSDLEFIYKRYDNEKEGEVNPFDIRLMQEGRMKGQAFITFETVDAAQKALKETNGYILKDKPLVVVFARSALPKK